METTITIKVRNYHVDQFKHVNHARYIEFMEEARWSYLEDNNIIEQVKLIPHVVVSMTVNYHNSATPGDVLTIETGVLKADDKRYTIRHLILLSNTDVVVADAEVTNVFIDPETGKAIPIDERILGIWPDLRIAGKSGTGLS